MRLALYEPDIPQNCGALIRLAACLGVGLDIIEPCGFLLDDKRLRRAGLDYHARASLQRHRSWAAFQASLAAPAATGPEAPAPEVPGPKSPDKARLLLLTTAGDRAYTDFAFAAGDILLLGRESAGVPPQVHAAADARLAIPLQPDCRSLNMAQAAAMVLGEALRQTGGFPRSQKDPT